MAEQPPATLWNGDLGEFWGAHAAQYELLMAGHARRLVDAAGLTSDDRVLDVGCGTGTTSRLAAERAASVVGLDVSRPILAAARARTTRSNLTYVEGDAQTADLPAVDVVLSQFGVMFFDDPDAAFANVRSALVPGGRLAFLCWRDHEENENRTLPRALAGRYAEVPPRRLPTGPGAFSFGDPDVVRGLLGRAGFREVRLEAVDEPMVWGRTLDEATTFAAEDHLDWMDPTSDAYASTLRDLREELASRETEQGFVLGSAAWLVTAQADAPA